MLHMLHLWNVCGPLIILCLSTNFMPIRIFANVILKYWHLHTIIIVCFNLLPFIVVIIAQVIFEELYLSVTLFVFLNQFLIVHSCTCNTLILTVYEFASVPTAACDIFMWSYICNTFCWFIEIFHFLFLAADPPAWVLVRLPCPVALVFAVSSFISKITLLLPMLNSFALFWFSLMRLSNSWMLPSK